MFRVFISAIALIFMCFFILNIWIPAAAIAGHEERFDSRDQADFLETVSITGDEMNLSVIQTSDDCYVVAGHTTTLGAGSTDCLLIKYDTNGNIAWARTLGGTSADRIERVIQNSDGDIIVTGSTASTGAGGEDILLAGFNINGNHLWTRTIGGTSHDNGYDIVQTSDGGYALTGQTSSFGAGGSDSIICKLSASMDITWTRVCGGSSSDSTTGIAEAPNGDYIIIGYTDSFGAGNLDLLLVRYDASGNYVLSRTAGGSNNDKGKSIYVDDDDNALICGWTSSTGYGNYDSWITKYSSAGTITWSRLCGGSNNDYAYSLTETADGNYFLCGFSLSFIASTQIAYLMKVDPSGNLLGCSLIGNNPGINQLFHLQKTAQDEFVSCGTTRTFGTGQFNPLIAKTNSSGLISGCAYTTSYTPSITFWFPTVTFPGLTVTAPSLSSVSRSLTSISQTLTPYMICYVPEPTHTPTSSPTQTPTETPTDTPTSSPTQTPTETPTHTPTVTPVPTDTMTPSPNPTATPTDTATQTPTSSTATPTETPVPPRVPASGHPFVIFLIIVLTGLLIHRPSRS
ncbi:SBBP repeat-containing protein [bacterium]|nr:SBBP repeat-containing protein [candidate division CSSED10-310 bacterium]